MGWNDIPVKLIQCKRTDKANGKGSSGFMPVLADACFRPTKAWLNAVVMEGSETNSSGHDTAEVQNTTADAQALDQ